MRMAKKKNGQKKKNKSTQEVVREGKGLDGIITRT